MIIANNLWYYCIKNTENQTSLKYCKETLSCGVDIFVLWCVSAGVTLEDIFCHTQDVSASSVINDPYSSKLTCY